MPRAPASCLPPAMTATGLRANHAEFTSFEPIANGPNAIKRPLSNHGKRRPGAVFLPLLKGSDGDVQLRREFRAGEVIRKHGRPLNSGIGRPLDPAEVHREIMRELLRH